MTVDDDGPAHALRAPAKVSETPDPDTAMVRDGGEAGDGIVQRRTAVPNPPPLSEVPWRRFVAVGDSFTEGLWDPAEGPGDCQRGWADRLAAALAWRLREDPDRPFLYANLAIRGRLLGRILAEQLGTALAMRPDLVSFVAGGNDLLRLDSDVDALLDQMDRAVRKIRSTGADVLLATSADPVESMVIRRIRGRAALYYAGMWSIARRHGAHIVDLWGMKSTRDVRLWAPDRLHLTGEGHRRVANAALLGLGLEPDDPDFDAPLPPAVAPPLPERAREEAAWVREHLAPWVGRHLQGRSSGDGRNPKRPTLAPIEPASARK
ncbi:MAG: SGNH/GDSL hydrolase family protein [Bifidobacteriaceae bacterium]|jgi:lysophospholipase L1-like esterase|nr:SGNH/GDSL hydrolase family protein [Bifidobacteriaceae bacterium]